MVLHAETLANARSFDIGQDKEFFAPIDMRKELQRRSDMSDTKLQLATVEYDRRLGVYNRKLGSNNILKHQTATRDKLWGTEKTIGRRLATNDMECKPRHFSL